MVLAAAVALLLVATSAPQAMAKGVFFDPDSPAGKEYALPLDQARDEAAGLGKSDGPAGKPAPLFGEGISGRGPGDGQGSGGGSDSAGGASGGQAGEGEQGPRQSSPGSAAAAAGAASAADGYPLASGVAWVAVIVALGALVGLALRGLQRLRPT